MTDRELMQQVWDAMANVGADFVCEASHHVKKDQHGWHEPCPIQQRWHIAFEALSERLAKPKEEPRQWQGLTDEEIAEVISGQFAERNYWVKITKALEAKLKEKNT